MSTYFQQLAENLRIADLLDVGVIAVLIYLALIWCRRRASRALVLGVAGIAGLYLSAHWLEMYLTTMLFQAGFAALLLAMVVVLQQDIRRAFDRVAASADMTRTRNSAPAAGMADTLVEAISTLADNRTGALIVLPGREPLDRHVRGGVVVDGRLSLPLLFSVFDPHSPGHDGAVIVSGARMRQFGVHLPLSTKLPEIGHGGTRHAAALGLAELCDALVIAVSEERGTISVGRQGTLHAVEPAELSAILAEYYRQRDGSSDHRPWYRRIVRHSALKLVALVLATAAWLLFAYRVETIHRTFVIPIEYRNLPEDRVIDEPRRTHAEVTLSGNEREFQMLDVGSLVVSFDLEDVTDARPHVLATEPSLKGVPARLKVMQIQPEDVQLSIRQSSPDKHQPNE